MTTSKRYIRSLVRVLLAVILLGAVTPTSGQNKKITRQPVKEEKAKEKPKTNPAPKQDNKPKQKKDPNPSRLRQDATNKGFEDDNLGHTPRYPIESPGTQIEFQGMVYMVLETSEPTCKLLKGEDIASVAIPSKVTFKGNDYTITSIGTQAFSEYKNLQSLTIPNTVTSIGSQAFYECESLQEITIPGSVTSIGKEAFADCINLREVIIRTGVTSIPEGAFLWCRNLRAVTIPETVTSIGQAAFSQCESLESVTIPESVTSIGMAAFSSCKSLREVTLPKALKLPEHVFAQCPKDLKIIRK